MVGLDEWAVTFALLTNVSKAKGGTSVVSQLVRLAAYDPKVVKGAV